MAFEIELTQTAAEHIRAFRKFEQQIILDAVAVQLPYEPTKESRNRKLLGENELSDWELRVGKYRIFYDVMIEEDRQIVKIKAVGYKEHNILYIGKQRFEL